MKNGRFSKSIEIWRIMFALSVVFCHAALIPQRPKSYVFTTLGVEFFFMVSGYLMAASGWHKPQPCTATGEETWQFIFKKLKVIFPMYALAAAFELIHAFLIRNNADPTNIPYYFFDFLFIKAAGWRKIGTEPLVGASWYLSAYFISILLLYPFLRKNRDFFVHIAAPAISILGGGWFIIRQSSINYTLQMDYELGICFGLIRGIVEMCIGCTCFGLVNRMGQNAPEKISVWRRIKWTVTEIGSMAAVFYIMTTTQRGNSDFLALVLLAFGIIAAFSGYSYTAVWLEKVNVKWVSGFALALYLNHYAWYRTFQNRFPECPFVKAVALVLLLSIASSLLCLFVVKVLHSVGEWKNRTTARNADGNQPG